MWNVSELFRNTVKRTPDRTAVVDPITDRRFTYADVDERVERLAAGFRAFDIEKGERIGLALPNTPEHVFLFLAVQRVGAVAVPFNFHSSDETLRYFVSDADLSMLVFGGPIAEQVLDLRDELDCETFVTTADVSAPDVNGYERLVRDVDERVSVSILPDDGSVIQYSSGTTGDPKGIEITHRGGVERVFLNVHSQRMYDGETVLGRIHLFHTLGVHGMLLSTVLTGGTYIPVPEFDREQYRRIIAEENVTVLHEAPVMYERLLGSEGGDDTDGDRDVFGSVEIISFSGAPMSEDLLDATKRVIDPDYIYNTYGMTEIFPPYTKVNLRHRDDPRAFGYAGVDGMRIVEIDEHDPTATVEAGREGELVVHRDCPGAFEGYLRDYENAEDAFEGDWYFTGDACIETEDGCFAMTGRLRDLIKYVGENIYPENVETVLADHPNVEETAVVGIDDDEWGEVPKAFVVADGDLTAADLDDHCVRSDALEEYKRPREYEFVGELPE